MEITMETSGLSRNLLLFMKFERYMLGRPVHTSRLIPSKSAREPATSNTVVHEDRFFVRINY